MPIMRPVTHIDTGDIHPANSQSLNLLGRTRRRANRADQLRPPGAPEPVLLHLRLRDGVHVDRGRREAGAVVGREEGGSIQRGAADLEAEAAVREAEEGGDAEVGGEGGGGDLGEGAGGGSGGEELERLRHCRNPRRRRRSTAANARVWIGSEGGNIY